MNMKDIPICFTFYDKLCLRRNGQLYYKHWSGRHNSTKASELLVKLEPAERERMIEVIHLGSRDSDHANCLVGLMSRHKPLANVKERYYLKGVSYDVAKFVSNYEKCQAVPQEGTSRQWRTP